MNGGKVKNCSRIKDGNQMLGLKDDEVRRISKDYFEDLYMYTQEQIAFHMCGFDGV